MDSYSRECLSMWKGRVYRREYQELVLEVSSIAGYYYNTSNRIWIKTFEALLDEINGLTQYMISHNEKKIIVDFIRDAIKTIKGEYGKLKIRKKTMKTIELLARPYSS